LSAFRSDDAIIAHLERLFAGGPPPFGAVIVVDSLGSGRIRKAIEQNQWEVRYHDSKHNLGSAGNLDLRIRTAMELGFDWCLTVNHDGVVSTLAASEMLDVGEGDPRIGAVYPVLRMTSANNQLDRPRRSFLAYGFLQQSEQPAGDTIDVVWSSSNGALYRLAPFAEGASAWPQLWMGYEDLAIGWELHRQGWRQVLATKVIVEDNYELKAVRFLGKTMFLADKPSWYAYYQGRNLVALWKATKGKAVGTSALTLRLTADVLLAAAVHRNKRQRIALLFRGVRDGLAGRFGKGPVP
jgi:GT2 family glycosyltransferase